MSHLGRLVRAYLLIALLFLVPLHASIDGVLPSEGCWMTPDPAGFIDGPNLYHFCHNSPHSFVDWIGLKCTELTALIR